MVEVVDLDKERNTFYAVAWGMIEVCPLDPKIEDICVMYAKRRGWLLRRAGFGTWNLRRPPAYTPPIYNGRFEHMCRTVVEHDMKEGA